MILNNADNMMFGSSEIDRVYCGSVKVWERGGGNIPEEVQAQVAYLKSNYFSKYSDDDLYYIYGLYGSNSNKPLMYAVTMIADPNLTGIRLNKGDTNSGYISFTRQSSDDQMRFAFSAPSSVGSDTSFPSGYSFSTNTTALTTTFRTWTPSGSWGSMNPIVLYGDYPAEKIAYVGTDFDVTYNT